MHRFSGRGGWRWVYAPGAGDAALSGGREPRASPGRAWKRPRPRCRRPRLDFRPHWVESTP